jgi:hypothetical protein
MRFCSVSFERRTTLLRVFHARRTQKLNDQNPQRSCFPLPLGWLSRTRSKHAAQKARPLTTTLVGAGFAGAGDGVPQSFEKTKSQTSVSFTTTGPPPGESIMPQLLLDCSNLPTSNPLTSSGATTSFLRSSAAPPQLAVQFICLVYHTCCHGMPLAFNSPQVVPRMKTQ